MEWNIYTAAQELCVHTTETKYKMVRSEKI